MDVPLRASPTMKTGFACVIARDSPHRSTLITQSPGRHRTLAAALTWRSRAEPTRVELSLRPTFRTRFLAKQAEPRLGSSLPLLALSPPTALGGEVQALDPKALTQFPPEIGHGS